jgi:hypothetical protein
MSMRILSFCEKRQIFFRRKIGEKNRRNREKIAEIAKKSPKSRKIGANFFPPKIGEKSADIAKKAPKIWQQSQKISIVTSTPVIKADCVHTYAKINCIR